MILARALLFSFLVTSTLVAATGGSAEAQCLEVDSGVALGTVENGSLTDISGIAASREFSDVLWAHDDSGDSARVFAMAADGAHLATFNLTGATNVDWEDMAIGPGPVAGIDYLYFADTGNNSLTRSTVTIYRVAEPQLDTYTLPVTTSIGGVQAFPVQYPDTRRDAETLLVDPVSGDWFVVTRDRSRTGTSYVYLYPAPQQAGVTVTLQLVATLSSSIEIKGGDVSPSGDWVILRTHSTSAPVDGLLWYRAPGTDLESVFATTPCAAPFVFEPQGEAVAFTPDGSGYYTIGEGASAPVYFYSELIAPAAPAGVGASALSSSQIRVVWTDASTNEAGFALERSTDGTTFAQVALLAAGSTSRTDTGLAANTTYWYRVTAYNDAGSATSAIVSAKTLAATTKPNAPTSLTATAISSSRITLRWTDNSSNETGFRIQRSTNGSTFSTIATVSANTTSITNAGLQSNRVYYYRVSAYNGAGDSAWSNTASARTRR